MTSQSLNTNKKRAGFASLFGFTARQFWTTALLFTIILFFILPVPVMMTISDRTPLDADDIVRLKNMFAEDWIFTIRYFVIIAASIFGVVVSCSRFAYLKNKVSIDFYHSLPVKRGRLFATQLAVAALSIVIPYVTNILFTVIVFASNGLISEILLINILLMSAQAFVYSVFFFSLSTLIGMVSGLTAVQLTLTIVATFIVPVAYLLSVAFISIFNENMWTAYYINERFFEVSTPALRLALNEAPLSALEAATLLLVSAAMLFGSYVVYMKRKSERAGTPVVFTPLGEVIKYVLVFLGTLGGGLLFYFIMESLFWTVFGMICGAVLVFMLANTILQKTARSMFKGWKGLCIFGVCAATAFIILVTNAFGINTNVPSTAFTSRIEISFDGAGGTMEFTDKEVIDAMRTVYTEGTHGYSYNSLNNYFLSSAVPDDPYYYSSAKRIQIVFYPKIGVPVAKFVRIYNSSDFIDEFKTLLNSEQFKAQYATALDKIDDAGHMMIYVPNLMAANDGAVYDHYTGNRSWDFDTLTATAPRALDLGLDLLLEENKNVDFDFFQQQTFGSLYVYEYGTSTDVTFPLFTSMTELQERYVENGFIPMTQDKTIENLARAIKSMKVTKYESGEAKTLFVTDTDKILEILKAADNPHGSDYSPFTFTESDYSVSYELEVKDSYNVEYYYDENGTYTTEVKEKAPEDVYTYTNNYTFRFLIGRVPDFVIEYFAK